MTGALERYSACASPLARGSRSRDVRSARCAGAPRGLPESLLGTPCSTVPTTSRSCSTARSSGTRGLRLPRRRSRDRAAPGRACAHGGDARGASLGCAGTGALGHNRVRWPGSKKTPARSACGGSAISACSISGNVDAGPVSHYGPRVSSSALRGGSATAVPLPPLGPPRPRARTSLKMPRGNRASRDGEAVELQCAYERTSPLAPSRRPLRRSRCPGSPRACSSPFGYRSRAACPVFTGTTDARIAAAGSTPRDGSEGSPMDAWVQRIRALA